MNLARYCFVVAVLAVVSCNYAGTLFLNASSFNKTINRTVPHIPNSDLVAVIRDIDSSSKFTWNMTYDLVRGPSDTDTVVFTFQYEWPSAHLTSLAIDYLLLEPTPGIHPSRECITSFQTHLQLPYLSLNKTYYCLLFPVGWSNLELTSGFTYMAVLDPSYKMFAIHYMHMSNHGSHDHAMGKMDFDDKGEWVTFQYVVVEEESLETGERCKVLDNNGVQKEQQWKVQNGCRYFGGLKSSNHYQTKGQFFVNNTLMAFKDFRGSGFGIAAFPLRTQGLVDKRVFTLVPSEKIESESPEDNPMTKQVAQQDYWFVVYIMGTGVLISGTLLLYAHITLRRSSIHRQIERQKLVRKGPQTLQITSHTVPCADCGKQIQTHSEDALEQKSHRVFCENCKQKDVSDS